MFKNPNRNFQNCFFNTLSCNFKDILEGNYFSRNLKLGEFRKLS